MGTSRTGSHADGVPLYHPDVAFPPALRAAWPAIRARLAGRAAAGDAPAVEARPLLGRRPGLRRVLTDPHFVASVARVANDLGIDEADAAALAARVPEGDEDAVRERIRLWLSTLRVVHRHVRQHVGDPRKATRLALRAHVLSAVARLADGPDAATPARTWVKTRAARGFWRRVSAPPWIAAAPDTAPLDDAT